MHPEKIFGRSFDHGHVARQLTPHRGEFFASVDPLTAHRFSDLIARLDATA